jgi:hypothetical protein
MIFEPKPTRSSYRIQKEIPEDAVFIIGAGHFGNRAARLLDKESDAPLFIVDVDEKSLSRLNGLPIKRISYDGILFLVENYRSLKPENTIVPAVPVHLVCEWLKGHLEGRFRVRKITIPEDIKPLLPFTWQGSEGSLLVSYADFDCPDDCPEDEFCTVTGERRDKPLHDFLSHIKFPGYRVHVVRSRQLAPGLGGYKLADLMMVEENLSKDERGKWLLCTACKCHGIISALEIHKEVVGTL